jgi:nitrite reductase/ring-hydroxylating ferredoxin subunit
MYRTTKEESEILNGIRAGTPMGDFLRRYWQPVGFSKHLKNKPTFIRVLGEDLVLFRQTNGLPALVGALCPHRRANLCLGSVEPPGIRCKYHGWMIDAQGAVLETPGEPPESTFKHSVKHGAYPVEELGGLIFAYFGPQPAPLLPRYDILVDEGRTAIGCRPLRTVWIRCIRASRMAAPGPTSPTASRISASMSRRSASSTRPIAAPRKRECSTIANIIF